MSSHLPLFIILCLVGGSGNIASAASPVYVDILAISVLLVGSLGLDAESVSSEVITLGLQKVGREVLCPVAVEPRKRAGESGCGNTEQGSLGNNVSPAGLSLVDSLVEEVVEKKVLKVGVVAVGRGDVLKEHRADDAATTPHEGDGRLVELPAILLGSLLNVLA